MMLPPFNRAVMQTVNVFLVAWGSFVLRLYGFVQRQHSRLGRPRVQRRGHRHLQRVSGPIDLAYGLRQVMRTAGGDVARRQCGTLPRALRRAAGRAQANAAGRRASRLLRVLRHASTRTDPNHELEASHACVPCIP